MAENYMTLLNNQQQVTKDVMDQVTSSMERSMDATAKASQFNADMNMRAANFAEGQRVNTANIQAARDRNYLDAKRFEMESALQPLKVKYEEAKLRSELALEPVRIKAEELKLANEQRRAKQQMEADLSKEFDMLTANTNERFGSLVLQSGSKELAEEMAVLKNQGLNDVLQDKFDSRAYSDKANAILAKYENTKASDLGRDPDLANSLMAHPALKAEYDKRNPLTRAEAIERAPLLLRATPAQFLNEGPEILKLLPPDMKAGISADRSRLEALEFEAANHLKNATAIESDLAQAKTPQAREELGTRSNFFKQKAIEARREIEAIESARAIGNWSPLQAKSGSPDSQGDRSSSYRSRSSVSGQPLTEAEANSVASAIVSLPDNLQTAAAIKTQAVEMAKGNADPSALRRMLPDDKAKIFNDAYLEAQQDIAYEAIASGGAFGLPAVDSSDKDAVTNRESKILNLNKAVKNLPHESLVDGVSLFKTEEGKLPSRASVQEVASQVEANLSSVKDKDIVALFPSSKIKDMWDNLPRSAKSGSDSPYSLEVLYSDFKKSIDTAISNGDYDSVKKAYANLVALSLMAANKAGPKND